MSRIMRPQYPNYRHLSLALALLKPDITNMPYTLHQVRQMILKEGFIVLRSNIIPKMKRAEAEAFYEEHRGRFFYNRLVTYMSSGSVHAHILALPSNSVNDSNAITTWRKLMGPTKVMKTRYSEPDTIRGTFGLSDTRTCSHGSDSLETAKREIEFFFPDFDPIGFSGSLEEKELLRKHRDNLLTLNQCKFVHY